MDKSLVRSTYEVTFSLLLGHKYENGIVRNKILYSLKMLLLNVLQCFFSMIPFSFWCTYRKRKCNLICRLDKTFVH